MRNGVHLSGLGLGQFPQPVFLSPPAFVPSHASHERQSCSVGCREPPPHTALQGMSPRAALGLALVGLPTCSCGREQSQLGGGISIVCLGMSPSTLSLVRVGKP